MKFQTKYKILLWKSYFDKGYSFTNYLKYFIAFFALSSLNVTLTMWIAFFYAIFCMIFGYYYFKYGWVEAEIEVSNKYNLFVREIRKKFKNLKYV